VLVTPLDGSLRLGSTTPVSAGATRSLRLDKRYEPEPESSPGRVR
jgi:hypothetical protein